MGKVSMAFIVIGLVFLLPATVLTVIPFIAPIAIPSPYSSVFDWFNGIIRAFVLGVLFVVAFGFIIFGVIIAKRDSE